MKKENDTSKQDDLLPGKWSKSVALDPKHRPQSLEKPSTTVRKEWARWPQEAHLLDRENNRYRRLSVEEIATIQGFETDWLGSTQAGDRELIKAIGNAVPPPLSAAIFKELDSAYELEKRSALELGAGIGGLTSGVEQIGLHILGLVENWETACQILKDRGVVPEERIICKDVLGLDFERFKGDLGLLTGGLPCQPWSQAGNREGESDERDLMGHTPTFISSCEPEVFLFENVPGLVNGGKNEGYLNALVENLRNPEGTNEKYGVAWKVLNAADFGVPQKRRRLFILGIRSTSNVVPRTIMERIAQNTTHSKPTSPNPKKESWTTLREAFENLPDPGGWRRFLEEEEEEVDQASEMGTDGGDSKEGTIANEGGDSRTTGDDKKMNSNKLDIGLKEAEAEGEERINLRWPTKGKEAKKDGEEWVVQNPEDYRKLSPLLFVDDWGEEPARLKDDMAVTGGWIEALRSLQSAHESEVKLAYMDAPRIDDFNAAAGSKNSIWMSLVREVAVSTRPLLDLDGAFVLQVDDDSYHYARLILEEVFGPFNYVCTGVWQKKYGPQNDSDVPTPAQEYFIVYAKDRTNLPLIGLPKVDDDLKDDGDPRGPYRAGHKGARSGSESTNFEVNIPPYRWRKVGGELPPGIWRISPKSGAIWGVPEEEGRFDFSVEVEDREGNTARDDFTLVVREPDFGQDEEEDEVPEIWWLTGDIEDAGELSIATKDLPEAHKGVQYTAVLEASGGVPRVKKKKPGSGRYWEFSLDTLRKAVAEDRVYFGRSGDAIPDIKKYQEGKYRKRRVLTWWPYEEVGKSEDASKHLQELADKGYVDRVERIAKPEKLMGRIIKLFTRGEGDKVLTIGDVTASMSSTSLKLDRDVIHLTGKSEEDIDLWERCAKPRLRAVYEGEDESEYGVNGEGSSKWGTRSGLDIRSVESPLIEARPEFDEYRLDLETYPPDTPKFSEALCALIGFRYVEGSEDIDGITAEGDEACKIILDECLTKMRLGYFASEVAEKYENFTILYECADIEDYDMHSSKISLIRVPYDLIA